MKNSVVYGVWAFLYFACVALGFVPNPEGLGKYLLILVGCISFIPPFYLAWKGKKEQDIKVLQVVLAVSSGVLVMTMVMLVLNFLSVYFSKAAGIALYILLILFSAPMACCQYWAIALFLWYCVFVFSLQTLREQKYPGRR